MAQETSAQKQARYRQRKRAAGLEEVRVFAPPHLHAAIREMAAQLIRAERQQGETK